MHIDLKSWIARPQVYQGACVLFSVLIIWQVVAGYVRFSTRDRILAENTTLQHISSMPSRSQAVLSEKQLRVPLFGEYIPTDLADADIKRSMLDVRIVGIVLASNEKNSRVIVQKIGAPEQQILRVGDTLPGGAFIKHIMADGILVMQHGELERLNLSKKALIFDPVAKPL